MTISVCGEFLKEDYINLQNQMAGDFLASLIELEPRLDGLLDPNTLLDALGCVGLSLHIGEESSLAFIRNHS